MKKVVTIGGGTGSFMLLSGLKEYPIELSAIVSMADDGGSTGVLRDELGVLPPGDVRQCLVALSESSEKLRNLMSYRFENGGLKGHSFGNLLLSALEKTEGSFVKGVEEAAEILNVRGTVVPVTGTDTTLMVELNDGTVLSGEHEINTNNRVRKLGIKKAFLKPRATANPDAVQKIKEADLVIIGPGNHYCSIIPNLLVAGIQKALKETKAKIVYNCNLVNKKGHTNAFTLDDYVTDIERYIGKGRIDYVTFNKKKPSPKLIALYQSEGGLVEYKPGEKKDSHYAVIETDLLAKAPAVRSKGDTLSAVRSYIRHDHDKLAGTLMELLTASRRKR